MHDWRSEASSAATAPTVSAAWAASSMQSAEVKSKKTSKWSRLISLTTLIPLAAVVIAYCSAACHADVISGYNFGSDTGTDTSFAATTVDAGAVAGSITRGTGVAASGSFNSDDFDYDGGSGFHAASLSAAETGNDYFQFTVSAAPGDTLSLTSVTYWVFSQNNGTTPQDFSGSLQYSLDGFATQDGVQVQSFSGVTPDDPPAADPVEGNLEQASLSLSDLPSSVTVTFRFYGYDAAAYVAQGLGGHSSGNNDVELDGTITSTPEPASLSLLALGAAFLLTRRGHAKSRRGAHLSLGFSRGSGTGSEFGLFAISGYASPADRMLPADSRTGGIGPCTAR